MSTTMKQGWSSYLHGLRMAAWLALGSSALAALPEALADSLRAARLPESALAAVVLPVNGGPPRLQQQAELALNPASSIKLLTTLAALETLGPAFSWRTGLYTEAAQHGEVLEGDLYLRGSGDPRLTYERVWLLLRELRSRGIRQIHGDLVLDRSYFRLPASAEADFDEQPERAYNVAPDALLLNFKALRFDIDSTAGDAVQLRIDPALPGVSAQSRMRLIDGDCARWSQGWARPEIREQAGQITVTLQGSFPANCRASRYLGLLDPVAFADRLVRGLWAELGGEISGATREAPVPAASRLLAETQSPPFSELIRDINKLSNNTMARTVLMSLGAENPIDHLDSEAAGRLAVQGWLSRQGLHFPELVLDNGAGLSRSARISASHLAAVLQAGARSPLAAEFAASLPIVGIDGTMRRRLPGSALVGSSRIKTGTLDGVRSVAGYVRDSAGQDWVVVGLLNHPRADGGLAVLDALLQWAATPSTLSPEVAKP